MDESWHGVGKWERCDGKEEGGKERVRRMAGCKIISICIADWDQAKGQE